MWSSSRKLDQFNSNQNKGLTLTREGRGPSSSSTTSSSSPFSPLPTPKTMEEVWKDINLSSLHSRPSSIDHHHHDSNTTTSFQGMILQDFLGPPFPNKDSQRPTSVSARYGSSVPSPATMLTLNSGPEFHFLGSSHLRQNPIFQPHHHHHHSISNFINDNGKKRSPDLDYKDSGDRRHKRMIKNRESAARSRARKQAYMQELMLAVSNLEEENARLKEQQRQLLLAAADPQHTKKRSLQRTSSAPF